MSCWIEHSAERLAGALSIGPRRHALPTTAATSASLHERSPGKRALNE
jgi:hypothetical protein